MKKPLFVLCTAVLLLSPLLAFPQWKEPPIKKKIFSDETRTVYEVPGEHIYHVATCPLLGSSRGGISQGEAEKRGDKPCPSCFMVSVSPGYEWNFDLKAPVISKVLIYADGMITIGFMISKSQVMFDIQKSYFQNL